MPIYHNLNPQSVSGSETKTTEDSVASKVLSATDSSNGRGEGRPKLVIMQGPLGKIYTDALNLVYAQESQANDAVVVANELGELEEDSPDMFVYVTDSEYINKADISKEYGRLRLALDSKKFNKSVMVLESLGKINNKLVMLDEFARSKGMHVVYSRKTALEVISNGLRRNHG